MPLYEYHCHKCGADFEAMVSFSQADDVACENCGSHKTERVASTFACSMSPSGGSGATSFPACGGGG